MKFSNLREKKWFNGAVIACIGVAFFVFLTHLNVLGAGIRKILGFFRPVILGVVFAYILSPLTKLFYYQILKKMKVGKVRWWLSVLLSFSLMLLALFVLLGTLLPQIIQSYLMFSRNFDQYAQTLLTMLENSPLKNFMDNRSMEVLFQNALTAISGFVTQNAGDVVSVVATSGKNVLSTVIGMILAVYLLIDVKNVLIGARRLMHRILPKNVDEAALDFLLRCDTILVNYIVQSLIDALIIGTANAIFMVICRMPYIALISVVVGVTNLVPNFGPAIGAVIGTFILLLVSPSQALLFLAFCGVLQFFDGYILKPKLFSNSMGVSGLTILIFTIVLGNMFGILGVLLSIPTAAILSFLYHEYFMKEEEEA